jgi:sterol desaturase/sphingolipid hydroxylase (fatty acid hydroxylase superfamily)
MPVAPQTVRLAAFLAGLAASGLAESIFPRRPWRAPRARRWAVHGGLASFNTVLVNLTVAAPLAGLAARVQAAGWGIAPLLGLSGIPEILATLVVLDLADYFWHRWNHEAPILWRFHGVHHVDTHVDATTSLRFHPGELLISAGMKAVWILAWGPSVWGFALFELMVSLASQYHHGNFDLPDAVEPAARLLHVTPRMHASHHSAVTRSLNANYATILSVWDRIFGTYIPPAPEHLRVQGLGWGRDRDLAPVYALALPFRRRPGPPAAPSS